MSSNEWVGEVGYEQLTEILRAAHDHAALGKGKERHANSLPFEKQRMLSISRAQGDDGGMAYQVQKKVQEGRQFDNMQQIENELLGAINYTVGMIIYHRERFAESTKEKSQPNKNPNQALRT